MMQLYLLNVILMQFMTANDADDPLWRVIQLVKGNDTYNLGYIGTVHLKRYEHETVRKIAMKKLQQYSMNLRLALARPSMEIHRLKEDLQSYLHTHFSTFGRQLGLGASKYLYFIVPAGKPFKGITLEHETMWRYITPDFNDIKHDPL